MEKNYRILRRVHGVLYTSVAENFQFYINSLDQAEIEEINTDFIGSGLNSIQNVESATELLMLFDFFYFINVDFQPPLHILLFPCQNFQWKLMEKK